MTSHKDSLVSALAGALDRRAPVRGAGLGALSFEAELDLDVVATALDALRDSFGSAVLWDTRARSIDGSNAALAPELAIALGVAQSIDAPVDSLPAAATAALAPFAGSRARVFSAVAFDPTRAARPHRTILPRWTLRAAGSDTTSTVTLIAPANELAGAHAPLLAEAARIERSSIAASSKRARSDVGVERCTLLADDGEVPFRRLLSRSLEAIASGELEKVVAARVLSLREAPPAGRVLDKLAGARGSVRFGLLESGRAFVGASPELLVAREGRALHTEALAGSEPRRGRDEDVCRALLGRDKDRREHDLVVRGLLAMLAEHGVAAREPIETHVRLLEHVAHLATPLTCADLSPRAESLARGFELALALHPTPALGGTPRAAALAHLARFEEFDRGFYGGPFGYVDARGDGAFIVAIRSVELGAEGDARAFSGAGIVRGSDPDAEVLETRVKAEGALRALGGARA
ncbi:MAG: chorismate-binding protein [Polyangiaceae bacterium]